MIKYILLEIDNKRHDSIREEELKASKDVIVKTVKDNNINAFIFTNESSVWMSRKSSFPAVVLPAGSEASIPHPFGISFHGNTECIAKFLLNTFYVYKKFLYVLVSANLISYYKFKNNERVYVLIKALISNLS
ncbi:hypothetical protein NDK25_13700 [Niallia taxi]|nr:hypothetical protein [Niallia taxi]